MDNLSPTSLDFEFAQRLQQEENRMILDLEEACRIDSASSEEVVYVGENSAKSEDKYGLNLLENYITDDEDDSLEAAGPNTLSDSLLAEQLQAQYNTSDTDESESLESAVRLQNEFEREARTRRRKFQNRTATSSDNTQQPPSGIRQRAQRLLNPIRRSFPLRSSTSSIARHRIPETLDGLLYGLSRAISMQQFNDFTTDPLGYLESSRIGNIFTGNNFSGNDYEHLWEIAEQLGEAKQRGLSKETLNTLPTSTFSSDKEKENNAIRSPSCVICMETYMAGDKLKTLPCLHQYHHECIDKWLQRERKCPVCQHVLENN